MQVARFTILAGLLAAIVPAQATAQASSPPLILVVKQPSSGDRKDDIDMSLTLAQAIDGTGRFKCIRFSEASPAIRDALADKRLKVGDVTVPLSQEGLHRVAAALGVRYTVRVTGKRTKQGIAAEAVMESQTGQAAWTTVFTATLSPYMVPGRTPSPLEGIRAQCAAIAERVTGNPVEAAPPVITVVEPKDKGKAKPSTPPDSTVKPAPTAAPAPEPVKAAPRPDAPSANEILVDRFRRQGDAANMIISLKHALDEKPRDVRLRHDLVVAYRERGWDTVALAEARRAVDIQPDKAALHRLLGDCLKDTGDSPGALSAYAEALKLDPADAANHVAVGDAQWNAGKIEEAEKAYKSAAATSAKASIPHRRLARLYALRGRFPAAIDEMKKAKEALTGDGGQEFADDYVSLLYIADSALSDLLARLQSAKKEFAGGAKTREDAFKETGEQKKRAAELAAFLEGLASPTGYAPIQGLYSQCASLAVQSAESSLTFLERQMESDDAEATVLRVEALKQLGEAGKRLKALNARKQR